MSLYAMYTDSTPAEIFIGDEVSKIKAQEKIGVLVQVILSQAKLNKAKKFQLWKSFAFDDNGITVWIYLIKNKLSKLIKVKSRRLSQVIAAGFYHWKLANHEEKISRDLNLAYEKTENELQSEIKELEYFDQNLFDKICQKLLFNLIMSLSNQNIKNLVLGIGRNFFG